MPNQLKTSHVSTLDNLIKEAELIDGDTSPFEEFVFVHESQILVEYKKWNKKVRDFFKDKDVGQYISENFFLPERIELPPRQLEAMKIGDETSRKKLQDFRKELHSELSQQILTLKNIREKIFSERLSIDVYFEKNGEIWRAPKEKYSHQGRPHTKRAKLLHFLIHSREYIETETLKKKLKYKTSQTLAKEKRKINLLLKIRLDLTEDIILGGNENRMKGYKINPSYRVHIE
jgi:hypothetical protein